MKIKKKKFQSGEATQFMTRRSALKKLQLSLKDFRKVCILKGIYPREPKNRKKAQKGATNVQTLYSKKDIQFLLHEPIIWKLREKNTNYKKIGKYRTLNDRANMKRYLDKQATLKLDHIVKERYPTFFDALRDLDDCLTLCFLFSTFPSLAHVPRMQSAMCRRLTTEFMHAIIEAHALRKVFVSIKGYYFQAEVKGVQVNWIVPHHFAFQPHSKNEVDFKIMATFIEFYMIMLGFINFRLYHELNLFYPPKFNQLSKSDVDEQLVDEDTFVSERVAALNVPLLRSAKMEDDLGDMKLDEFGVMGETGEDATARFKEQQDIEQLKTLFKGLKFYLNREVPREPLVFVIRCFGGEVSWNKMDFVGATFDESDETITHQICDRPDMNRQYISRYYIQPQWIFDSVNFHKLLPVEKYFLGMVLPPHLSPFVDDNRPRYKPVEELMMKHPELAEKDETGIVAPSTDAKIVENTLKTDTKKKETTKSGKKKVVKQDVKVVEEDEADAGLSLKEKMLKKMKVTAGQSTTEVPWKQKAEDREEFHLRAKMVKNKHRNLYKSMMEGRKKRGKEMWLLKKKRERLVDGGEEIENNS